MHDIDNKIKQMISKKELPNKMTIKYKMHDIDNKIKLMISNKELPKGIKFRTVSTSCHDLLLYLLYRHLFMKINMA